MKLFVYPFVRPEGAIRWDYDRFFLDRWCREADRALRTHPNVTLDPDEADLFVVAGTLACVSFFAFEKRALRRQLKTLAHRRQGRPHVIFDLTDEPRPLFDNDLIHLKSAFHERFYDRQRAVPIPQFPRFRFQRPILPARERPYLAGFLGHPRREYTTLRERMFGLHDGESMIVRQGIVTPGSFRFADDGEVFEAHEADPFSHTSLIFHSRFALLPRAHGWALSYRMVEAMNAGAIPVVLSDGYVLPFRERIDYARCAVRVPESEVGSLREILHVCDADADVLQAEACRVYDRFFSSTERIIHTALDECEHRISR